MTMRLGLLAGCLGAIGLLVQPPSGTLLAQNDPSLALSGQVTSTAEGAMEGVLVTAKASAPGSPGRFVDPECLDQAFRSMHFV